MCKYLYIYIHIHTHIHTHTHTHTHIYVYLPSHAQPARAQMFLWSRDAHIGAPWAIAQHASQDATTDPPRACQSEIPHLSPPNIPVGPFIIHICIYPSTLCMYLYKQYMYINMFTHIYTCKYTYIYVYVWIYIYYCIYVHICIFINKYIYEWINVYVYIYLDIHVYVYMHMYIDLEIHMCVQCLQNQRQTQRLHRRVIYVNILICI